MSADQASPHTSDLGSSARSIPYAILETGVPPQGLDQTFGTYPQMIMSSLGLPRQAVRVYRTLEGELPPHDHGNKGFIITGSPAGAYETDGWILDLLAWLRALKPDIPVVGICFGHQIMAKAWGGEVVKSSKGWGVGLHHYQVSAPEVWETLCGHVPQRLRVAVVHQDQVISVPYGAKVIASSEFTPQAALLYENRKGLSFQCHPEFETDYAKALLESRRGTRIEAQLVDQALESFETPHSREVVLKSIRTFLDL